MAAQKGRDVLIKIDVSGTFTTIGGARQKSLRLNDSTVDVTDSDSAGRFRELLAAGGIRSMSMSLGGVFKDSSTEALVLTKHAAGEHPDFQFIMPGLGTFEGAFAITGIDYTGQYQGEAQYSFSFESAGEITFTAA